MIHMIQKSERKVIGNYKNPVLQEIYSTLKEVFHDDYVSAEFDKSFPSENNEQFIVSFPNELIRAGIEHRIYCDYINFRFPDARHWYVNRFHGKTFKEAIFNFLKHELRDRQRSVELIAQYIKKEE